MEIGPISGIRPLPAANTPTADPRLPAVIDIEHSSEPSDDSYSGSDNSAAGGYEEEDEINETGQPSEEDATHQTEGPGSDGPGSDGPGSSIDLIA